MGWDVWNKESDEEVVRQDRVRSRGSTKRVDYAFKVGGVTKFFVEAKGLKEDIETPDFAFQAIGYGWHRSIRYAVLTNFEGLKVFNCEWNEQNIWKNQIFGMNYNQYLEDDFERLWLLSKESFLNGELDNYATKIGKRIPAKSVGEILLNDMNNWRTKLSTDLSHRYKGKFDEYVIDETVQRLLNRLIFIRTCEDRGLEEEKLNTLMKQYGEEGKGLWTKLLVLLHEYDAKYNSRLFEPSSVEEVELDDKVVADIIKSIYHTPDRNLRYDFALIDADILGNMYEQYLSHLLRKTPTRAKVEEKHAHRKEQGIYYTPTYVVDYIVQNTIGEWINGKTPEEVTKLKVLDPACGSGSFLIKAFDYLEKWHYDKNPEYAKAWMAARTEKNQLTPQDRILRDNIFGVDLDQKAVEIAQLNLLIKAADTRHRLPTLKNNIKNGNSLIDDPSVAGDKAFKWENEFSEIMNNGGFDVVIGNPPYISMERMKEIQPFFENRYADVFAGKSDILYYFIVRGIQLLKPGGYLGMIVSRYFIDANFGDKLRAYILQNASLRKIIDFRNVQIFEGANVLTAIIILQKKKETKPFEVIIFKDDDADPELVLSQIRNEKYAPPKSISKFTVNSESLDETPWLFDSPKEKELVNKLSRLGSKLGEICDIGQGMQTGLNEVFVVTPEILKEYSIEKSLIRKRVKNGDLRKFEINFIPDKDRWLIYTESIDDIDKFPATKKYLLKFEKDLKSRANYKLGNCEWFQFTCPLNKEIFESEKEKILIPFMATENRFAYDAGGKDETYIGLTDTSVLRVKQSSAVPTKYLVGMLNSKLLEFVHHRMSKLKRDNYYEYFSKTLSPLPIIVNETMFKTMENMVTEIISLKKKMKQQVPNSEQAKTLKDKVKDIEKKLDELVYKIYGITEDEKKIIEESLKA